jgi:hypothetical protein
MDMRKRIFIFCLITGCLWPGFAAGINRHVDQVMASGKGAAFKIGACEISVLDTYFWRDFMPIVSRPGPDGGSPLRAKVKLSIDNSRGPDNKFSFEAAIVDDRGQIYPVPFRIMEQGRMSSSATTRGAMWDGEIKTAEVREIVLVTAEGPYLQVGSSIHVEMTWTDRKGDSAVVRTPDGQIRRTD